MAGSHASRTPASAWRDAAAAAAAAQMVSNDAAVRGFPQHSHEPYYMDYAQTDLPAMFAAEGGLRLVAERPAWVSKVLVRAARGCAAQFKHLRMWLGCAAEGCGWAGGALRCAANDAGVREAAGGGTRGRGGGGAARRDGVD